MLPRYPPFMFSKGGKRRPKALKQLAQQELGLSIQEGQHSSVDDARAALYLYQKHTGEGWRGPLGGGEGE
jgi:RNA exonuclease 4